MRNSSTKTPWHLRFAPGALSLKETAATAGVAVIYGLLFAGLLLMPFQSHRAVAAAPPAEDNYEDQALPVLGIGAVFVIGLVAGYLATAAWDGTKWKAKQSKLPKGKVVADTFLVVDESTGVYSSWYAGTKTASNKLIPFVSYNKKKDYSWYDAQVVVVAYDQDEQKYKLNGEGWSWHGNGYIPSLLDMFNHRPPEEYNEDTGEYEFTTSGFYIRIGTTANIDLTHAFDSDVDEANIDDALATEASSKKYEPRAFVWLSSMNYQGSSLWEYTPRDNSVKVKRRMSATVDQYEIVDVVPKNFRLDRHSMRFNKSTLSWKWGQKKYPAGSTKTVTNPDGTRFSYTLPNSEIIKFPEPDQEIDTIN